MSAQSQIRRGEPKPTGEWTVGTTVVGGDKFPAIMCAGKVVWHTCLMSDRNELRQLCKAHKAALAAEREKVENLHKVLGKKRTEIKQLAAERDKYAALVGK